MGLRIKEQINNPQKDGSWDVIDVLSIYFISYEPESVVDLSRKLEKAARSKATIALVLFYGKSVTK